MSLPIADFTLFLLVFMRMCGAILFNPMFGRNNVPSYAKIILSLASALVMTASLGVVKLQITGIFDLVVCSLLELAVGLAIGILVGMLFSVVLLAGEMIDMQMGFSMATFYDPKTGINMPVLGSFFNILLVLAFFTCNAHLTLFRLVSDSFTAIPPGTAYLTKESIQFVILMGKDLFELGLRLAVPILAVEVLTEATLGILMRAVPQINIFTVGIQLKTIIGLVMLTVTIPVIIAMCGRLSSYITEKSIELVRLLVHT